MLLCSLQGGVKVILMNLFLFTTSKHRFQSWHFAGSPRLIVKWSLGLMTLPSTPSPLLCAILILKMGMSSVLRSLSALLFVFFFAWCCVIYVLVPFDSLYCCYLCNSLYFPPKKKKCSAGIMSFYVHSKRDTKKILPPFLFILFNCSTFHLGCS